MQNLFSASTWAQVPATSTLYASTENRSLQFDAQTANLIALRVYPKTCFVSPSASERIIGKAREAGVSSGYVDAAERSIGFVQPREAQMRFTDRLLVPLQEF